LSQWTTPGSLTALLGALAAVITAIVALVGAVKAGNKAATAHDVATTTAKTINGLKQQVDNLTGDPNHTDGQGKT
jgi:hypothetical protein